MIFLGFALLLGGYTLVYAGLADGGRFAVSPWLGFYADAYQYPINTPGIPNPVGPPPPVSNQVRPRTVPV